MSDLYLSFYSWTVKIKCESNEIIKRLINDFHYFKVEPFSELPNMNIVCRCDTPRFDLIKGKRRYIFRKVKTFDHDTVRTNIYDDKLLSEYDFEKEEGLLVSAELNLLHEVTYLLILSRIGKFMDQQGIHRLHAMNVQGGGRHVIACGGSGVGKSTMALKLIRENNYKLGADDVTLITKDCRILPFPIRVGQTSYLDVANLTPIKLMRREFGAKYLYDFSHLSLRPNQYSFEELFLLRCHGTKNIVSHANIFISFIFLFKYLVIGIGTPQVFEYFWEPGWRDFFKKIRISYFRVRTSLMILVRINIFNLLLTKEADVQDVISNGVISE